MSLPIKTLATRVALACSLMVACVAPSVAADYASAAPLDSGFRLLYNLDFPHAQQQFSSWEQQNRDNPMGPTCEAAGLLFSEFERLGILEAQFYENDSKFEARKKLSPDPEVRKRFDAAIARAETLAQTRLVKDANDEDALFAMTLTSGLKADYAALIEKRNMASLHLTKEATAWSQRLLAVHPQCYDAHLAAGVSKYIIGSMAAPVRWILRLGGVSGDKQAGISELQLTADKGHYLAPFARILLAIAYVRDKDKPRARQVLASLREEFPENPLFGREIARLDEGK
jgi:hypothetical protein